MDENRKKLHYVGKKIVTTQEGMILSARKNRKSRGGEQRVFCVGGGKRNKKARFVWSGLFGSCAVFNLVADWV